MGDSIVFVIFVYRGSAFVLGMDERKYIEV